MGYNNCTRREAELILMGKENDKMQDYDRYERPQDWPQLPVDRRNRTDKTPPPGRKIVRYEEDREENRQRRGVTYRDTAKSHNEQ